MTGSLAYRKNAEAIHRGEVPEKYTRLLPYIPGDKILEIGSAEGVLALLLARQGKYVTALEKNEERHENALRLYSDWLARENRFKAPVFVRGTAAANLDLLKGGFDTLIAVRVVYYLGPHLDRVFGTAAMHIPNVVLCGNRNRADRYRRGIPDEPNGAENFYASFEGMRDLLSRHGYRIVNKCTDGDEIVVGRRDG